MAGEREPLHALTPDDYGPIIVIVGYSLASISVVAAIVRFWHAAYRRITFGMDDLTFLLANVLAILGSILLHLAVADGLGKHISTLPASNINKFFKTMLAAQSLEITSMFFAKVSVLLLLDRIFLSLSARLILLATLIAWALFSLITTLICRFSSPWTFTESQCPAHGKLIYPQVVVNALTDAVLALYIVPGAWILQMPWKDKGLVMIVFGARILVCIPAIIQLCMLHSYLASKDQTWASLHIAILNLVTVYLSVICATIPRMNPLLSALQSGRATIRLPDAEIYGIRKVSQPSKSVGSQST